MGGGVFIKSNVLGKNNLKIDLKKWILATSVSASNGNRNKTAVNQNPNTAELGD